MNKNLLIKIENISGSIHQVGATIQGLSNCNGWDFWHIKNKSTSNESTIILGDGYTDYEVKKYGNADLFIQFTGNINRPELNQNADFISTDFSEIIEFINNV